MFIAAYSTIIRIRKHPKGHPTEKRHVWSICVQWNIYTMECYLAILKDKLLHFVLTWIILEGVMLCKIK